MPAGRSELARRGQPSRDLRREIQAGDGERTDRIAPARHRSLNTGHMRSNISAVLGSPIASWALFGCLTLAGLSWQTAGALALAWGAFWIGLSQLDGLARWISRRTRAPRRSVRRRVRDAILATLFLPLPVYVLALVIDWFALAPNSVTVTMLAMLVVPVPLVFWWAALRHFEQNQENIMPVLICRAANIGRAAHVRR